MVISIHPSPSQPLVDSAIESFSYRWLVTMAALGVEPPPSPPVNDVNGDDEGRRSGYFIDVDPKAAPRGGRDSVDGDLEFEFLVPPSRCSPSPADKVIPDGLLIPHKGTQDRKEKDNKEEVLTSSTDESRALTRSLSADSWSSTGTMFSSCPSRLSSASSSSSSSSSSVTPLKSKSRRLAPPAVPPPVSTGQSPLLPRLPKRREEAKKRPAAKKGGISLASIPQKIARLCLCLLAAACRRATEAVSTANSGSGSSGSLSSRRDRKAASSALPRRDSSKKKKGRKGVEGLSSAIQWCRTDADAVENSIHEAVLHCKRSYAKTD